MIVAHPPLLLLRRPYRSRRRGGIRFAAADADGSVGGERQRGGYGRGKVRASGSGSGRRMSAGVYGRGRGIETSWQWTSVDGLNLGLNRRR
jgi:hypothetical protein